MTAQQGDVLRQFFRSKCGLMMLRNESTKGDDGGIGGDDDGGIKNS